MNDIFSDLIIFEMANSHQGDVQHGIAIIKAMGTIAKKHHVKATVKLQYRHYDTFIHPLFRDRKDIKHIPRFLSTRLSDDDFTCLVQAIREGGMLAASTPFDEESVDLCIRQDIDIIKVASCSAKDWPLLEKVATTGKPIIASTGGLTIEEMDNLYNFFLHAHCTFALMHCCAIYPAPADCLQLNLISKMVKRYSDVAIGYSGHEEPHDVVVPSMAIAAGARILERHVALPTETFKINNYSMTPEQTDRWIGAIVRARKICGFDGKKKISECEVTSLESLCRGVYAAREIKKGQTVKREDIFYAMPYQLQQLKSGDFRFGITASQDYSPLDPLFEQPPVNPLRHVREIIHSVKGMLNEAGIILGNDFQVELSHHYGLEHFQEVGCTIVNIINREYCKKLIIMLPGQRHPTHYHKQKEETFQVLCGDMRLVLNGTEYELHVGQTMTIRRMDRHAFSTRNGLIFEEVSTTHRRDDSFYEDERIARLDPMARKSFVEKW